MAEAGDAGAPFVTDPEPTAAAEEVRKLATAVVEDGADEAGVAWDLQPVAVGSRCPVLARLKGPFKPFKGERFGAVR